MDGDETVLVTGGSGFLGGWCLVELLRGGYRARTTVRDLGRERAVRANVGSQVEVGDRLEVLAADLTKDQGWPEAIDGCDDVLHVASPFPSAQPKDPDELIVPARDGTLRVLRESLAARDGPAGGDHRAGAWRLPFLFPAGDRTAGRGAHAWTPAAGVQLHRRARCGGARGRRHDRRRCRRAATDRGRSVPMVLGRGGDPSRAARTGCPQGAAPDRARPARARDCPL